MEPPQVIRILLRFAAPLLGILASLFESWLPLPRITLRALRSKKLIADG
jgi:hypothetical protein